MTRFIRLVVFFARRRVSGGVAWLFVGLVVALVLVGMITGARMQNQVSNSQMEAFGGEPLSPSITSVDVGSVHRQVWDATNYVYLTTYPRGILLPLRLASRWLFIILPFIGMLLASRGISQELESGLAQTLYVSPVRTSTVGMARMLGDSLSISLLIAIGLAVALAAAGRFAHLTITAAQLVRTISYAVILSVYTSTFILVGNLVSATLKSSLRSIWLCLAVGLLLFAVQLVGENLFIATHRAYPTVPFPPREVNGFLSKHDVWNAGRLFTPEELAADATPAVYRYLLELRDHEQMVFDMLSADYQRERWYELVSPIHAIWEISGQLLQDRHVDATEIFAPIAAMNPPPTLGSSLQRVWPELTGMLFVWLALFAINVRALSRLEV